MAASSQRRVLLIDDSKVSLLVAKTVLRDKGFDVRTASDVDEFDAVLDGWAPDVILTDVDMPGITGPELCKLLKARYDTAHVPVVLYSSKSPTELEALAQDCQADAFVSKGEHHERLAEELELLCESMLW